MSDSERMDVLVEAVVELRKRVEQLDTRLAQLERPAQADAPPEGVSRPVTPAVPPPLRVAPPPIVHPQTVPPQTVQAQTTKQEIPPPLAPPPFPSAEPQHLETRMGLTWVNRIGVITLIIGVAFFFKYAIDNQWIGETGRVVLGVLAGLGTLAAGDLLWRRGQTVFAQGICGLGISILYLSFYATFGFYHLLPQAVAFVLMVLVTALAGALALRYGSVAIAALGMLGGYATPVLLSTGVDAPWTFFSYIFLISLGGLTIARVRRWRPLELLAFIATTVLYLSWFGTWFRSEKQVVATVAALAFYALFVLVDWVELSYVAHVLTGLALAAIWPETAQSFTLSLVLGAAGLAMGDVLRRPKAIATSFLTFWAAYAAWNTIHGNNGQNIGITFVALTVGFLLYLLWTPFQVLVRGAAIEVEHLVAMALNGAFYYGASYVLLDARYHAWTGLLATAVAGAHLLVGALLWKKRGEKESDQFPVLLALGIALGFLTLAVPIQFTGFTITLAWALEAAALVWISRRIHQDNVALAAFAVYAFVLARLFVIDAWALGPQYSVLLNSRFLTFATAAVSYWLGAWFLKTVRSAAGALYFAGHFVMFVACQFEFIHWAETTTSVDNHASLIAIGVSIVMALYAVLLIAIGVAYRSLLDRILGLGLIGLVIVKLYLYDVWESSRLFRTGAFVGLGVLLLLTSYLYSHFRPSIESLWRKRDEEGG